MQNQRVAICLRHKLTGKSEPRHSLEDVFACCAEVFAGGVVEGQAEQVEGVVQEAGVTIRL